jgi:hypothetical protein
MPVLTREEFQAIQQYVRDHYEAVMDQDRRIRERTAQRTTPPEIQAIREKGHAKALALIEQFARSKAYIPHNGTAIFAELWSWLASADSCRWLSPPFCSAWRAAVGRPLPLLPSLVVHSMRTFFPVHTS